MIFLQDPSNNNLTGKRSTTPHPEVCQRGILKARIVLHHLFLCLTSATWEHLVLKTRDSQSQHCEDSCKRAVLILFPMLWCPVTGTQDTSACPSGTWKLLGIINHLMNGWESATFRSFTSLFIHIQNFRNHYHKKMGIRQIFTALCLQGKNISQARWLMSKHSICSILPLPSPIFNPCRGQIFGNTKSKHHTAKSSPHTLPEAARGPQSLLSQSPSEGNVSEPLMHALR